MKQRVVLISFLVLLAACQPPTGSDRIENSGPLVLDNSYTTVRIMESRSAFDPSLPEVRLNLQTGEALLFESDQISRSCAVDQELLLEVITALNASDICDTTQQGVCPTILVPPYAEVTHKDLGAYELGYVNGCRSVDLCQGSQVLKGLLSELYDEGSCI